MRSRRNNPTAGEIERYVQMAVERNGTAYGARFDRPDPVLADDDAAVEKRFQSAITGLADDEGWCWFHPTISKRSKEGWPDLVLWKHVILYREVKTEIGQPTAAQLTVLDGLKAAGGNTGIWRPSMWIEIVSTLRGRP